MVVKGKHLPDCAELMICVNNRQDAYYTSFSSSRVSMKNVGTLHIAVGMVSISAKSTNKSI